LGATFGFITVHVTAGSSTLVVGALANAAVKAPHALALSTIPTVLGITVAFYFVGCSGTCVDVGCVTPSLGLWSGLELRCSAARVDMIAITKV
jgi:hypothetical protein